MIVIAAAALRAVLSAAETSYPDESCGLLIGRHESDGAIVISRVQESENVAPGRRGERFEIDPRLRFRTMRSLGNGPDAIVGHYHSHPDRPAKPSPVDVNRAYEPDLIWMITAVSAGQATETAAFRIDQDRIVRLDLLVRTSTA